MGDEEGGIENSVRSIRQRDIAQKGLISPLAPSRRPGLLRRLLPTLSLLMCSEKNPLSQDIIVYVIENSFRKVRIYCHLRERIYDKLDFAHCIHLKLASKVVILQCRSGFGRIQPQQLRVKLPGHFWTTHHS